jgi:hypothetical protein
MKYETFKIREKSMYQFKIFTIPFFQTHKRKNFGDRLNRLQEQVKPNLYKHLKCSRAVGKAVLGLCVQYTYACYVNIAISTLINWRNIKINIVYELHAKHTY